MRININRICCRTMSILNWNGPWVALKLPKSSSRLIRLSHRAILCTENFGNLNSESLIHSLPLVAAISNSIANAISFSVTAIISSATTIWCWVKSLRKCLKLGSSNRKQNLLIVESPTPQNNIARMAFMFSSWYNAEIWPFLLDNDFFGTEEIEGTLHFAAHNIETWEHIPAFFS